MSMKKLVSNPHDGTTGVTFAVSSDAPVSVVGDFNGWDPRIHPLEPNGDTMRVTVQLPPGRYAFRYLADGGVFFDDPDADLESNGIGGTHGVIEVTGPEAVIELSPTEATVVITGDAVGDDLLRIDGIGPKANAVLRAAGVTTFRQLADLPVEAAKAALASANIRSAPGIATWSKQARAFAEEGGRTSRTPARALATGRRK